MLRHRSQCRFETQCHPIHDGAVESQRVVGELEQELILGVPEQGQWIVGLLDPLELAPFPVGAQRPHFEPIRASLNTMIV